MSGKRVLSYVIGSNGAGKSTLSRNVLGKDLVLHRNVYNKGCITESRYDIFPRTRETVVAVGRYTSQCGGVDTVKPLSDAYRIGLLAGEMFPEANIFMESLLMSGLFSSPLKFLLEMKYNGFDVEICFLFATLRESMRRVFGRNGGIPIKPSCVENKLNATVRNFSKIMALGEFRGISIDTTKLSPEDVFLKFRKWSGLYEKNDRTA